VIGRPSTFTTAHSAAAQAGQADDGASASSAGFEYDVIWPKRDKLPELYVPSMCYQKTLYCYVKDDQMDQATLDALHDATQRWQVWGCCTRDVGRRSQPASIPTADFGLLLPSQDNQRLREQLGTSNTATPNSQTPRQSSQLAVRGSATRDPQRQARFQQHLANGLEPIAEQHQPTPH
jgi:hypothetical protein